MSADHHGLKLVPQNNMGMDLNEIKMIRQGNKILPDLANKYSVNIFCIP